ncbi:hypothetical protein V7S43_003460 [Phytophthora oleae]|uniref:FHA domain-containing protein n=1 Tax=Phytophthora oleae TaxID=2107226 RepID=A0ABD3FYQ5_9STRA
MTETKNKENQPDQVQVKPWGRFTFVSKDPAEDSDHIYFRNGKTTIGRNKRRCDTVINELFISSVHCVVQLEGADGPGQPIAKLSDNSRNGIWVNADRVGKGNSVRLGNGYTVHFTKPGTTPSGTTPMAYKFEFLNSSHVHTDPHPASPKSKAHEVPEDDVNMTVVADEPFEATQVAVVGDLPSPSEKKRKREDEEPAAVAVATQELESKLKATHVQLKEAENKLKAAETKAATLNEELEQKVQVQVGKLAKENLNLMSKLEVAVAETIQLKTALAAKDKGMEEAAKTSLNAASKENQKLKEELLAKDKAMALKIKEAVKSSLEADKEAKAKELVTKLKEATKKYQQKVEAEHFEQRREMSEKMAAFANENEKLQTTLGTKEEELAESEDKITRLRTKVVTLEEQVGTLAEKDKTILEHEKKISELEEQVSALAAKEKKLAECEEKIGKLEGKISSSKDENAEILGLLATAEGKVVIAENKAAEASIVAVAAAKASKSANPNDIHELQEAITSLRSELEMYRAQLASREEELKKQQEATAAAATAATVPPSNVSAESIAPGDDTETLRARLAAALSLFGQVQALGLHGVSLITDANSPESGDFHLLSTASADSARTTPSLPSSSSPSDAMQENVEDDPRVSPAKKSTDNGVKLSTGTANEDTNNSEVTADIGAAAEPKSSPSKLKHEKKRANKQAAPLSAAIEADVASAIAAMASANSSGKSSLSGANTAVVSGDGEGDWEMLE